MRDSKKTYRNLCSELVIVTSTHRRGRQGILANLEEIGERFVELLMDSSFPRATSVRIVTKDHELEGFVQDCRRDPQLGFFVKVKLAPQSRWSERWFTPKHLLQLWAGTQPHQQPKATPLSAASGY